MINFKSEIWLHHNEESYLDDNEAGCDSDNKVNLFMQAFDSLHRHDAAIQKYLSNEIAIKRDSSKGEEQRSALISLILILENSRVKLGLFLGYSSKKAEEAKQDFIRYIEQKIKQFFPEEKLQLCFHGIFLCLQNEMGKLLALEALDDFHKIDLYHLLFRFYESIINAKVNWEDPAGLKEIKNLSMKYKQEFTKIAKDVDCSNPKIPQHFINLGLVDYELIRPLGINFDVDYSLSERESLSLETSVHASKNNQKKIESIDLTEFLSFCKSKVIGESDLLRAIGLEECMYSSLAGENGLHNYRAYYNKNINEKIMENQAILFHNILFRDGYLALLRSREKKSFLIEQHDLFFKHILERSLDQDFFNEELERKSEKNSAVSGKMFSQVIKTYRERIVALENDVFFMWIENFIFLGVLYFVYSDDSTLRQRMLEPLLRQMYGIRKTFVTSISREWIWIRNLEFNVLLQIEVYPKKFFILKNCRDVLEMLEGEIKLSKIEDHDSLTSDQNIQLEHIAFYGKDMFFYDPSSEKIKKVENFEQAKSYPLAIEPILPVYAEIYADSSLQKTKSVDGTSLRGEEFKNGLLGSYYHHTTKRMFFFNRNHCAHYCDANRTDFDLGGSTHKHPYRFFDPGPPNLDSVRSISNFGQNLCFFIKNNAMKLYRLEEDSQSARVTFKELKKQAGEHQILDNFIPAIYNYRPRGSDER